MNEFQRGFEDMVFCARHWDAVWWLDTHWTENIEESARNAAFPPQTVERLVLLRNGENHEALGQAIDDSHGQALKVVRRTVEEMSEILKERTQCQCDDPRRKNSNSDYWQSEFMIRPKGRKSNGPALSIGASIDSAPNSKGTTSVFLSSWIWLKSKPGLIRARADSALKRVVQPSLLLGKTAETSWLWKDVLMVGASDVLSHADDDFRLNVTSLVDECIAPFREFQQDHIERLYELAR